MLYYVIGKEIKSGTYQGHDYKHLILYVTFDPEVISKNPSEGTRCAVIKLRGDVEDRFKSIKLNSYYRFYYDRFGNVEEAVFVQDPKK